VQILVAMDKLRPSEQINAVNLHRIRMS